MAADRDANERLRVLQVQLWVFKQALYFFLLQNLLQEKKGQQIVWKKHRLSIWETSFSLLVLQENLQAKQCRFFIFLCLASFFSVGDLLHSIVAVVKMTIWRSFGICFKAKSNKLNVVINFIQLSAAACACDVSSIAIAWTHFILIYINSSI